MAEMGHLHPGLALRIYAQAMRRDDGERARLLALVDGGGLGHQSANGHRFEADKLVGSRRQNAENPA